MKLYSFAFSSTSYRARIALNLKEVDYEIVGINLSEDDHKSDTFSALNPYQSVPILDTGEAKLYQSLAILDWLEDCYLSPSFLPEDDGSKQICREIYYAIATEIHAPNNLAVRRYIASEFGADHDALVKWNQTWIDRTFKPVEQRLATFDWASQTLPFGRPGYFEIVLIPQMYNARRWKVDLTTYPLLSRIDEHCQTLPPFEQAAPINQSDAPGR